MERELWPPLYRALLRAAADFRQKYVHLQPWAIAAVLLWAALHDRPVGWACDPVNWRGTRLRPGHLPSAATVSRRMRRGAFDGFLNLLAERLRGAGLPDLALTLDGKPLLIGGNSKDKDARFGRAAGHLGRGYKLHAIWGGRPWPEAWEVTSLHAAETKVAGRLLRQLDGGGGYVVADANYDGNDVYDHAAARGYQLVAPPPAKNPGCGHHYQSPHRLHSINMLRGPFGDALLRHRTSVERAFGNATSFGGGLQPLPAWVRRRHRVEKWVWAKLAINAVRIIEKNRVRRQD